MDRSRNEMAGHRSRGVARAGAAFGVAALLMATAPLVAADEHEGEEELPTPPTEMVLSQAGFSVPAAVCDNEAISPLIDEELNLPTSSTFISLGFEGGAVGDPTGDVFDVSYDLATGEMVIGGADLGFPDGTTVTGTWDGVTGDFSGTMNVPDSVLLVEVEDVGEVEVDVIITVSPVTGNISPEDFGGTLTATAGITLVILDSITCEIGPIELSLGTDPVERPDPPPTTTPEAPVVEVETAPVQPTPPPAAPVAVQPAFTG